jgi:hypothetical protein
VDRGVVPCCRWSWAPNCTCTPYVPYPPAIVLITGNLSYIVLPIPTSLFNAHMTRWIPKDYGRRFTPTYSTASSRPIIKGIVNTSFDINKLQSRNGAHTYNIRLFGAMLEQVNSDNHKFISPTRAYTSVHHTSCRTTISRILSFCV